MGRRQKELPGVERPTDVDIDEVADPYLDVMRKRMDLQKKERSLREQLIERMKQKKLKSYDHVDGDATTRIELVTDKTSKLKTKLIDPSVSEDEDDDE